MMNSAAVKRNLWKTEKSAYAEFEDERFQIFLKKFQDSRSEIENQKQ